MGQICGAGLSGLILLARGWEVRHRGSLDNAAEHDLARRSWLALVTCP
jgi:hypothetical protein